jgi:hypothetical protein
LGKTQARAKGIMKIRKHALFSAIADLVQALLEYGCEAKTIIEMLSYYGFTKEQIAEWYALDTGE